MLRLMQAKGVVARKPKAWGAKPESAYLSHLSRY